MATLVFVPGDVLVFCWRCDVMLALLRIELDSSSHNDRVGWRCLASLAVVPGDILAVCPILFANDAT